MSRMGEKERERGERERKGEEGNVEVDLVECAATILLRLRLLIS